MRVLVACEYSGRDNTPNTSNRAKERSLTFMGLALAIAEQSG